MSIPASSSEQALAIDRLESIAAQSTRPIQALRGQASKLKYMTIWRDALLPYLCTRFVLMIVGLLGNYYVLPLLAKNPTLATPLPFPDVLWVMWRHFDSGFYIQIAWHNYQPASALHSASNWAFYPFYPLLLSGLGRLLGGDENGFILGGLLISNLAGLVAIGYLYALVRREFNSRVASRAVLYLAVYPLSFYLSAVYPEALFLALSIACIYYARQQSWWLAGLCGGFAALTRSQGIVLVLPLAYEYLRITSLRYRTAPVEGQSIKALLVEYIRGLLRAARELKNWFTSLALFLVPAGLFAFMLYAKLMTGDLLANFHTEQWGWGRQLTYPWRVLIYSLRHPFIGQPLNWNFWLLNIVLAFAFLGVVVWAWRKLPTIYALYTTAMVLLPISANLLNSLGRLYLAIFPVFMLLALRGEKNERIHTLILISFVALQALFMLFYVMDMPTIA